MQAFQEKDLSLLSPRKSYARQNKKQTAKEGNGAWGKVNRKGASVRSKERGLAPPEEKNFGRRREDLGFRGHF